MDADAQIQYWASGSEEDLDAAATLLDAGKIRHALFFAHLSMEKMLKAHVVRTTKGVAPSIHDLLRLADLSALRLTTEQRAFLARFQAYCFEGRYPDRRMVLPDSVEARKEFSEAQEVLSWLMGLLK